jgi:hypothetical protein
MQHHPYLRSLTTYDIVFRTVKARVRLAVDTTMSGRFWLGGTLKPTTMDQSAMENTVP